MQEINIIIKEGTGKAAKNYAANKDVLREDGRSKYRNLSKKRKIYKKKISQRKIPNERFK